MISESHWERSVTEGHKPEVFVKLLRPHHYWTQTRGEIMFGRPYSSYLGTFKRVLADVRVRPLSDTIALSLDSWFLKNSYRNSWIVTNRLPLFTSIKLPDVRTFKICVLHCVSDTSFLFIRSAVRNKTYQCFLLIIVQLLSFVSPFMKYKVIAHIVRKYQRDVRTLNLISYALQQYVLFAICINILYKEERLTGD